MAALWSSALVGTASAADSAVILMYHRFGDDRYPSTNVRLDQFESHLAELKSGGYHVLPVPEIVAAIRDGSPLPDRTVGITIDDAGSTRSQTASPTGMPSGSSPR